jgi:hypothetical protein
LFFRFRFSSAFAMNFARLYIHYLVFTTVVGHLVRHCVDWVCGFLRRRKSPEPIDNRMWLQACKEYATKHGKWVVPKKDSPEYAEIKKIQERMGGAKAPEAKPKETKPRKPRVKVEEVPEVMAVEAPVESKPRKVRAKKVEEAKPVVETPMPTAKATASAHVRRGRKPAPAAVNDVTERTVVFA